MKRVAINGFGRIGRTILRAGLKNKNIKFVAINDLSDINNLAYLLKHDTAYKKLDQKVKVTKDSIIVGNQKIKVYNKKDPSELPWKKLNVDVVVESTGVFRTKEQAETHLKAGAKRVIISAPAKGNDPVKTVVYGVNHKTINKSDKIISNASCTTNCLAPIVKVLNEKFGINNGFMTTTHAYTTSQGLVDSPHSDFRRGRSAPNNIVPTTTGAAKAIDLVLPELSKKINGIAIRVPVLDGSLIDLTLNLKKQVTEKEINQVFEKASKSNLKNILEYSKEELVSSDIIGNTHACIVDPKFTSVNKKTVKVLAWYDNEFGYCSQLIKLINYI